MKVFRVIDKILVIFLLIIVGPFLLVGTSAVASEHLPLLIGFGVGLAIVWGVWKIVKRMDL